jgi:hypothetical protein
MVAPPRPFIKVLVEISDCRHNCGKRHPLAAILALARSEAATVQRIATGATVEPVPPCILSGCITKANS